MPTIQAPPSTRGLVRAIGPMRRYPCMGDLGHESSQHRWPTAQWVLTRSFVPIVTPLCAACAQRLAAELGIDWVRLNSESLS